MFLKSNFIPMPPDARVPKEDTLNKTGPCNFASSRVRQKWASIAHDRVSPGLFGTANSMTTIFAGPSAGPFSESEDAALIYHAMREGDAVQSAAMMVVSNVRERTSGRRAA